VTAADRAHYALNLAALDLEDERAAGILAELPRSELEAAAWDLARDLAAWQRGFYQALGQCERCALDAARRHAERLAVELAGS
jgi:hypothetical protein